MLLPRICLTVGAIIYKSAEDCCLCAGCWGLLMGCTGIMSSPRGPSWPGSHLHERTYNSGSCWSAKMAQVHEVGEGLELPRPVKSSLYSTTSEGPLTLPCVSWICPGSSENLWDSHRSCKDRDESRHLHYRFRTGRMPGSLEANHIHEEGVLPSSEFRQFHGQPGP